MLMNAFEWTICKIETEKSKMIRKAIKEMGQGKITIDIIGLK